MSHEAHDAERRRQDRRTRSGGFLLVERRSGFDRRPSRGAVRGWLDATLIDLRDNPGRLVLLLLTVNTLNLLDHAATLNALASGAAGEGNPVMAALLSHDPAAAAVFKITVVALVSLGIWRLRSHRVALEAACVAFALFAALIVVHAYGIAFVY